nr:glutamate dehydrogenase {EC 1.4.1.3} [cattle, liver, Peptide Partial, 11 aa] [Bos taurus]
AQHSQHRTPCK